MGDLDALKPDVPFWCGLGYERSRDRIVDRQRAAAALVPPMNSRLRRSRASSRSTGGLATPGRPPLDYTPPTREWRQCAGGCADTHPGRLSVGDHRAAGARRSFGSPAHVTGAEPESPQPAMTMIVISNHIAVDRVMSTLSEQRLPPCPCGETPGGLTQEWARSDRQMGEHEGPHNGELQDPLSHGIQV